MSSSLGRNGLASNAHNLAVKRHMRITLDALGISQKAIAIDLGVDQGHMSRMLSHESRESLPAHLIPAWVDVTGDASILDMLRERCADTPARMAMETPSLIALLSKQAGGAVSQLIQANEDGILTEEERRQLGPEIARLLQTVQTLALAVASR